MESSFGPTLLDLGDIYGTTTSTISFMFVFSSVGTLLGSLAGSLMISYIKLFNY